MEQAEADDFVGMTESDATTEADRAGYIVRVTRRDGEYLPITHDYRAYDRINFNIENGIVVAASFN